MGPKVLKFCTMMRWRFLKPSSFQKLYKLATPFFHSPGISLNGLTMLLLSEYACLTTGTLLLLQRTPIVVSSSIQDRGSITGLRHIPYLAIPTTKMLTLLYLLKLLWLCQGHLVQKKEAALNSQPPLAVLIKALQLNSLIEYTTAQYDCVCWAVTHWILYIVSLAPCHHLSVKGVSETIKTIPTKIKPKDLQKVCCLCKQAFALIREERQGHNRNSVYNNQCIHEKQVLQLKLRI